MKMAKPVIVFDSVSSLLSEKPWERVIGYPIHLLILKAFFLGERVSDILISDWIKKTRPQSIIFVVLQTVEKG